MADLKAIERYGNNGQGSAQQMNQDLQQIATNPDYVNQAIQRTQNVMANRQKDGMDTSVQQNYLNTLMSAQQRFQQQAPQYNVQQNPFESFLKQQSDSYYTNQQAQLDMMRQSTINDLEKAYHDAISSGQISIRDAEKQFSQQAEQINQEAYLDSQRTNLNAESRGIQNSQQMLGMQASDDARKNSLINSNVNERDSRINDIQDRINAISQQKSLDIANANAQYQAGLLGARSQADMMYAQNMYDFGSQNYFVNKDQTFQRDMQNQQFAFQNADREDQQSFQKGMFDKETTRMFDMAKTQHGYDLDKIAVQLQNEMKLMAQQNRYSSAQQAQSHANSMALASAKATQAMNKIAYEKEMALQEAERMLNPNSREYKIAQGQINMETEMKMKAQAEQAMFEAKFDKYTNPKNIPAKEVPQNNWLKNNWTSGGWAGAIYNQPAKENETKAKTSAYDRYIKDQNAFFKQYGIEK